MVSRLDESEAALARAEAERADLSSRANAAERAARDAEGARQRQLADVTNMRWAGRWYSMAETLEVDPPQAAACRSAVNHNHLQGL
jgi:uncharacterized membrane protein YqiK